METQRLRGQSAAAGQDSQGDSQPPSGYWHLTAGRASLLLERRALAVNLLLLALLLAASAAYLMAGSIPVSASELIRALAGDGEVVTAFVIHDLRLPRLVAAWLTGAAFALAGCLMQTLARNRLATPGIIGIDNGATAFAIASVIGVGVSLAPPAMALSGGLTAAVLTFGLAAGSGTQGYRFIIAGIGVGAVFGAITQLMLARVPIDTANAAYPWTVGSLNARPGGAVLVLAIGLAIGMVLSLGLARSLSILRFKDATAAGLGISVKLRRFLVLLLSVAITAVAVAVAGPVGMVGLIGPEIARALSTARHIPIVAAALAGALVMVLADLTGRTLLAPIEIPVGIVTAVVGGPWLIWILIRPASRRLT